MGERRYSEEALQTILGEAATLSAQRGDTYSLADMQRIAGEIDIDPELVTRAAAAMPIGAATPALPAAAPLVRQVGHRATMAEMTAAIGIAREEFGELGTTVAVGDGVEWRYDSGFSAAVVSIMPESAHTVVRIDAHASGRQVVLYFGAVAAAVATGFLASTTATPTFSIAAAAVAIGPCLAAAHLWWRRSQQAAQAKLVALADALAQRLA
ncbi:MAG: hypothetical protein ACK5ZR_04115 [Gemmatimonadaceae bacterium]|jgi:hypothetical protein|nr:hypothetical protein [Gemmatimonadota bacterium]